MPEGSLFLWTGSGVEVFVVGAEHGDPAEAGSHVFDVSPDGSRLLVNDAGALVSVEVSTGERLVLVRPEPPDELQALAGWGPDGTLVAFSVGSQDPANRSTLCLVSVPPDEPQCYPEAGGVYTFAWSSDGSSLVIAGPPAEPLRLLDVGAGVVTNAVSQQGDTPINRALREAGLGYTFQLVAPMWSPSGRYLAALANLEDSRFTYVPVVFTQAGEVAALGQPSTEFPEPMAWSPAGDHLAYTRGQGPYNIREVRLLDPQANEDRLLMALEEVDPGPPPDQPIPAITDLAWSPSGRWLAVGVWEGMEDMRIIDPWGGEPARRLTGGWETWRSIVGWVA
ncbi:MAG: WD40 repeat domain-containing protein [Actinomycetota bacterium]